MEQPKYTKKRIPAALKAAVWNKYIGEDVGSSTCQVCNNYKITQLNFHCGHIIPESQGGETVLTNLRAICSKCNLSMGKRNLNEFQSEYFPDYMECD